MNALAPSPSLLLKALGRPKLLCESTILCFVRLEQLTVPREKPAQLLTLRHFEAVTSKLISTPVEYALGVLDKSQSFKLNQATDSKCLPPANRRLWGDQPFERKWFTPAREVFLLLGRMPSMRASTNQCFQPPQRYHEPNLTRGTVNTTHVSLFQLNQKPAVIIYSSNHSQPFDVITDAPSLCKGACSTVLNQANQTWLGWPKKALPFLVLV
jgi:hypothetical protein